MDFKLFLYTNIIFDLLKRNEQEQVKDIYQHSILYSTILPNYIYQYSIIFYLKNMSASIKYQVLTLPYFQQARKLISKEFSTNNIVITTLNMPLDEIYQYRYDNLKFQENSGMIAVEVESDRVVGVVLTEDFLTFIQHNQKSITFSQGLEFYRQTFVVPFIKDYLQRYPNLKRGEFVYNYAGCIDAQFSNQGIFNELGIRLYYLNKNRGYKFSIGITHEPKLIRRIDPKIMIITEYKVSNPIFKGKHISLRSIALQMPLNLELKAKL